METPTTRSGSWLPKQAAPLSSHKGATAFSLVELLSVIAIISVLGGLLATNLSSVLSSRASAGGVTLVSNLLHSARQQALSAGLPVAVVFASRSGPDSRQAVVLLKGTLTGGSLNWEASSPWNPLSNGVMVDPIERDDKDSLYEESEGRFDGSALAPFDGRQVADYFYLVYRPDGSIDAPEISPGLVIRRQTKPDITDYVVVAQENTGRVKVVAQ